MISLCFDECHGFEWSFCVPYRVNYVNFLNETAVDLLSYVIFHVSDGSLGFLRL